MRLSRRHAKQRCVCSNIAPMVPGVISERIRESVRNSNFYQLEVVGTGSAEKHGFQDASGIPVP